MHLTSIAAVSLTVTQQDGYGSLVDKSLWNLSNIPNILLLLSGGAG